MLTTKPQGYPGGLPHDAGASSGPIKEEAMSTEIVYTKSAAFLVAERPVRQG
ncbi:hypothetical protein [Microbacterium oleivorans]|uniref:hypothetical protein n=1 Tax=Microbacterium oleivorans TaxID=273677 RepID=UPI000A95A2D8|nr:hypothetical protein [Microbacterium oleivorans]